MDIAGLVSYVLIATFTPGPNNVLSMTNATRDGFRRTLPYLFGVGAGAMAVFTICAGLVLALGSLVPAAVFWLSLGGTLYMLALGIIIMTSRPHTGARPGLELNNFRAGFLLNFVNIKVIIYGFTVFAAFVIGAYRQAAVLLGISAAMALTCFVSVCAWAAGGHLLRRLFERRYRLINLLLGGILALMALINLAELLAQG
ncbi:MAG: LysE family transporter [Anaerolineae bacterium]